MMQVDVKNAFNIISFICFFRELQDVGGPLVNIVLYIILFCDVHFLKNFQHGQDEEGVIIIESSLGMKQNDP